MVAIPKIKMSTSRRMLILCLLVGIVYPPATASEKHVSEGAQLRPYKTDDASGRLINNYLAVSGGRNAHERVRNVVARGRIKEASVEKDFTLVETSDGKRHLTLDWLHLGRRYKKRFVFDGVKAWQQTLLPKEQPANDFTGQSGLHFSHYPWLLFPFTLPASAKYVFEYRGTSRVNGRSTYLVKGYGREEVPSWYYFDKEKFLIMRWGGAGLIAGVQEQLDYRATEFQSIAGLMLPSRIDLLAENAAYGFIEFSSVKLNDHIGEITCLKPKSKLPVLRRERP